MAVYAVPTVALGRFVRVSVNAAGETVILSGPVVVSTGVPASVAFTLTVEVPTTVGVPLTTHAADIESPAGSVPLVSAHI